MKWTFSSIFLLYLCSAAQAQPTGIVDDNGLSLDEINYLGGRMHQAFTELHLDTIANGLKITLESDKALIRKAVTTSPHSFAGLDVLETGCEYFYSTESDQLSQKRLAGFFVDSEKESMKVRYEFMVSTYNALSERARALIDAEGAYFAEELRRSGGGIPGAEENLQHYYRIDLDALIARYTDFCDGGLDESRQRLEDPNNVFGFLTF